jgi:iron complex outermembrane receptor protein
MLVPGSALAAESQAASVQVAAASPGEPGAAADAGALGGDVPLDEVVVTARRRQEKVQDVPISLSVLSGAHLEDTGTDQIVELQFQAPSTSVFLLNPRNAAIAIRGIGNNPANDGLAGSTGIYIDGIYLDRQGMANTNLLDIDQIEVLRGPQGTLFGKNTTAGALNITTNKPTFTPEGSAEVTFGSHDTRVFKGTVSGPLVDNVLAGRLAAYDESHSGYITSPNGGPYDDLARWGLRGQLLFDSDAPLTVGLTSDYSQENDHSGYQLLYSKGSSTATIPFSKWSATPHILAEVNPGNPFETNANEPQVTHAKDFGTSLEANWTSSGGYTLTSLSGLRYFEFLPRNNSGLTVDAPTANGPLYSSNANDRDWQASEEIRLASPTDGPVDFVTGLYYFWKRLGGDQDNVYSNEYSALTGAKNAPLNNATLKYDSTIGNSSYAAFGQANWHIADALTLTGGVRETYEEDSEHFVRYGLSGGTGAAPSSTIPYLGSGGIRDWNTGELLTLAYKVTDDILSYVTVSHGAKAGGFVGASTPTQTGTSFAPFSTLELRPEGADDIEAGVKSEWLDRRLSFNIDAFLTRITNYQVATTITTPTGIGAAGENVGAVISKGIEFEATARPLSGLSLTATGSYNPVTYQSFRDAPAIQGATAAFQDLTGRPVDGAPRWTASISGTYTREVAQNIAGYFTAEYAYKSGQYGYIDDSSYSWIKGYGLTNLRIGATVDDSYDISLWVRNAFNTATFDVVGPLSGGLGGYYANVGAPRVVGGTFKYHFQGAPASATTTAAYAPPPAQAPAPPPSPRSYLVFFDFNKSDLTSQAVAIVDAAAKNAVAGKVTQLSVTGHTDTVGSDAYNLRLSRRRAESVAAELEKKGISASEIEIVAKGKRDLLVPTADGVREPQNRRVQIVFQDGANA